MQEFQSQQQQQQQRDQVRMRGTRDGLILQLPDALGPDHLLGAVGAALDEGGAFFRDAELTIDYGQRPPERDEIELLRALLAERGVGLRNVTAATAEGRTLLRIWGFTPLRVVARSDTHPQRGAKMPAGGRRGGQRAGEVERQAVYVKRTLRSGASVESDDDLVIVGDVNAGAHVSAAGDVIVWGALRGTVQAGAATESDAVICALRLQPTQLRIGGLVARPPDDRGPGLTGPHCASVENGEIVVKPWKY